MQAAPEAEHFKYVDRFIHQNAKTNQFCRTIASAVAGCAAGILGLTGISGFVFYAISWVVMSLLILAVKARGVPKLFFKGGARQVLTEGVSGGLFSFILFQTFLYGIVHLYQ